MPINHAHADRLAVSLATTFKSLAAARRHAPSIIGGVESAAVPLLFALCDEPLRVGTLAERVQSDVSTVSRQVGRLVDDGLLNKVRDPDDGRAQMVELSPSGRQTLDAVRAQRATWMQQVLSDWSDEEADDFAGALDRLRMALVETASTG
ncbi:MarR family winged helix-turn-helix transcriptional regulator [Dermacoccaceae bacterium W4C1]